MVNGKFRDLPFTIYHLPFKKEPVYPNQMEVKSRDI